jgi:hypothetical protein
MPSAGLEPRVVFVGNDRSCGRDENVAPLDMVIAASDDDTRSTRGI